MFRRPHLDPDRNTREPRSYTVLGSTPGTKKPIFPRKSGMRNSWDESREKIVDLLEGYCRLMDTFSATLKNPNISIEEKMFYLEETYGEKSLNFLKRQYKSQHSVASSIKDQALNLLTSAVNNIECNKQLKSSLFNHFNSRRKNESPEEYVIKFVGENAINRSNEIKNDVLKNIYTYDNDQLYLTIKTYLSFGEKFVREENLPNNAKDPHNEMYREVFEAAYKVIRPHCKELNELCSTCVKEDSFTPPPIFKGLQKSLSNLTTLLISMKLENIAPIFIDQFNEIFVKLSPELKNLVLNKGFTHLGELAEKFILPINLYMEAIELKKFLDHFIKNLRTSVANSDEEAQEIFLGLLADMIKSMVAHKAKFQGSSIKNYQSKLPSKDDWADFFEKIKGMDPMPQFKKKSLEEVNDQKMMDPADLIAPMGALTVSSESEEAEKIEKEDEEVLAGVENNNKSSLVVMSKKSEENLVTSRSLTAKTADKSYRDRMIRVLSHAKNAATYENMFNSFEKSTVTWHDLFACIRAFGGYIDSCGKSTGSGSKVMLPSMLTPADELAPSLEKAVNFHKPHGKRSDSDTIHRGILEEFKAGFIAAGLTPEKFDIGMADEEKKTKPRSG